MASRYKLRFPFRLSGEIEGPITAVDLRIGGHKATLSRQGNVFTFEVTELASWGAAEELLAQVCVSLHLILLRTHVVPKFKSQLGTVAESVDPTATGAHFAALGFPDGPTHGVVDGDAPAILDMDKTYRVVTGGTAHMFVTTPVSHLFPYFAEGATGTRAADTLKDKKLGIALSQYAFARMAESESGRLLNAFTGIEVLSPQLKIRSIRDRIRRLILDTLADDPDVSQLESRVLNVNKARNSLVHEGELPSDAGNAGTEAQEILRRLLERRLCTASGVVYQ
jgi:hypothetical protein